MKRKTGCIMLSALIITLCVFGGCSNGKTIIQQGNDTKVSKGMKDIGSGEQDFSTKCLDVFETEWDDEDGLYIYTKTAGSIPYVLIWRFQDTTIAISDFIKNYLIPEMQESYEERLISVGEAKEYDVGGTQLPGILFKYLVGETTVCSLRVFRATADGFVSFNAKYIDGEDSVVLDALNVAVQYFKIGASNGGDTTEPSKSGGNPGGLFNNMKVKKNEAAEVTFEKYTGPNGYFTMEIPKGWQVSIGLKPDGAYDIISYAITVSDPSHPERQLYFNLNNVSVLKTKEAHDWYVANYGADDTYSRMPYVTEQTTAGYFAAMGDPYGYSDFTVMEDTGKSAIGNDVLVARSVWNGIACEGLFSGSCDYTSTYFVQQNPFDFFGPRIDVWPVTTYMVVIMNAAEDEFITWKPVFDRCLGSLQFSERFQQDRAEAWRQLMGAVEYASATASEISDIIMDSWEQRNATYDVISQKQSDSTLGYERVYDTQTGEYYRAENGFTDWYKGDRYQAVTEDSGYLEPVTGYIEWK